MAIPYVSVPRPLLAALRQHVEVDRGGDWDWMSTSGPPPHHPLEESFVPLQVGYTPTCSGRPGGDVSKRRKPATALVSERDIALARGMSDTKSITVERVLQASSDAVFDVLSNPARHVELDGSGFVKGDVGSNRIQQVGDVFTMDMEGEHMGGEYRTDNHVTGYSANKLLAWQTAPSGQEPPGWQWVWELESQGSDSTLVRHTYDWSRVSDKELLSKVSFPLVSEAQLEESLTRLDEAVTRS